MTYSVSRLTLFAVLSSIEEDLRRLILLHLEGQADLEDLLGAHLLTRASDRLEQDLGITDQRPSLEQVLMYVDFGDLYQILNSHRAILPNSTGNYIRNITSKLEKLVPVRNRVAHSRPLNYDDLAMTLDIAQEIVESPDVSWTNLKNTLSRLDDEPSFVLGLTIPAYEVDQTPVHHNLPLPDFDETGFLGRKQKVENLKNLCVGPYPVITIVGEGGIGKTALALKVAYDLLDLEEPPFEAIVWTSSKTTQLTPQEIVRIEGAIHDSLGVFQHLADEIVGEGLAEDPLSEVLEYMKEFKILLILDNLETVLDDRIRSFLEQLPTGSKVLITSRIGLGAYEHPLKLQPMDEREAIQLLRALAKARGVDKLFEVPNNQLSKYCQRMNNNPGFIKWFVSAVQTGSRPEEVLAKSDVFLEFCMSNVYDYLSTKARKVLRSLLCLPGRHSQAELAFLNSAEALELQPALHELMRTNMVNMSTVAVGSSFESQYELIDLARDYLSKQHPVSQEEYEQLKKRQRQLVSAGEQMRAEQESKPYSFYSIKMRSSSDMIVAKYLLDSLKQAKGENFDKAEELIDEARRLAPEFFEVHRVEAIVKAQQGNYSAANDRYEAAVELEPRSAPLRKWYGGFLLRYMNDVDRALEQFLEAAKLDPTEVEIQLEIARARLYLMQFDEAIEILESIVPRTDLPTWPHRKAYDLYLQCFYRRADHLLNNHDRVNAVDNLEKLRTAYSACLPHLVDNRMKETMVKAKDLIMQCVNTAQNKSVWSRADKLADWYCDRFERDSDSRTFKEKTSDVSQENRLQGAVRKLLFRKSYGFIRTKEEDDYFFHRDEMVNGRDWFNISQGDKVSFLVGTGPKGRTCATKVILEDSPS